MALRIDFKAHYIGRRGACAKTSYGCKGFRHYELVEGRTFGLAIAEGGYVMLREIGGVCAEVSCAVPVGEFRKMFSKARS